MGNLICGVGVRPRRTTPEETNMPKGVGVAPPSFFFRWLDINLHGMPIISFAGFGLIEHRDLVRIFPTLAEE